MFRPANLTRLARAASRGTHISRVARAAVTAASRSSFGSRHIHATSTRPIAILEDRDRKPKASERSPVSVAASDITEAEYHQLADEYLETLLSKFEELQDAREDVDVEFSVRFWPSFTLWLGFNSHGIFVLTAESGRRDDGQLWS